MLWQKLRSGGIKIDLEGKENIGKEKNMENNLKNEDNKKKK